jgi:hypothetical protein
MKGTSFKAGTPRNSQPPSKIAKELEEEYPKVDFIIPQLSICT